MASGNDVVVESDLTKPKFYNCSCKYDHPIYQCDCGCGIEFAKYTDELDIYVMKPNGDIYRLINFNSIASQNENDWMQNLIPFFGTLGQLIEFIEQKLEHGQSHPIYVHIKNKLGGFDNDDFKNPEILAYRLSYEP
jgi:hypothetical protein